MADWNKILSRGDVEDRRGFAPVVGGLSLTGVALLLAINYFLGGDPMDVLNQIQEVGIEQNQQYVDTSEFEGKDSYEVFASTVLGSNNETWTQILNAEGETYAAPKLVLFRTATESSCGLSTSEVGPHYCPLDETIYLDETFFDELTALLGAQGGDVAEAYVIAHEVGHHVQHQLGLLENKDSIQTELQADCFAGLWAHSIRDLGVFQPGEIQEAMDAAASVGDDRIQKQTTGSVNPETWTHGSSEQRVNAFNTGFETGEFTACSEL